MIFQRLVPDPIKHNGQAGLKKRNAKSSMRRNAAVLWGRGGGEEDGREQPGYRKDTTRKQVLIHIEIPKIAYSALLRSICDPL